MTDDPRCEHGVSVVDLCADNDRLVGEVFARDREIRALLKEIAERGTD